MREERSNARESGQKLAPRTGKGHFVREACSDARKTEQNLASRTGRRHLVRDGVIARWGNMVWEMYGE